MAAIFISYRKNGADKARAFHLAQDLREAFGPDAVFIDEQGLRLGRFDDQLLDEVKSCQAMLAVIGHDWKARIQDLEGRQDWVRLELEAGLTRGILMVPILVDEAQMPNSLPQPLRGLFDYQFYRISTGTWKENVSGLVDNLSRLLRVPKRRIVPTVPNLSGSWTDQDGVPIKLEHVGDDLRFSLLDGWGRAIGQGNGTITGNQVRFSLRHPQYGVGSGTGTASSDGCQVSGFIQYTSHRFGFNIVRN
jgi:hypothetical protein